MENKPLYRLVAETGDYLIIDKPAGVLVHHASKQDEGEETLADRLAIDHPEIAKVGEDPRRPGIVHRLDRPVSGLMAVARTQDGYDHLKQQFQSRRVRKVYTALACGRIKADEGVIDLVIKRSAKGGKMAAGARTFKGAPVSEGRTAVTEFAVQKRYVNYTLLSVRIRTGRSHQIRCHLAAYGHPLAGDDLYGTNKTKARNKKTGLGRVFLAATELGFTDREGKERNYQTGLGEELEKFLAEKAR